MKKIQRIREDIETSKLQFNYCFDVDKMKPYIKNARLHDNKQVDQIAASIEQFDFINPIILDDNNEIIAGHGRYLAAKKLGLKHAPVILINYLTEEYKRLYRIADNKLTLNGKWDEDILALEFEELSQLDLDVDLNITGFENTDIDLMISDIDASSGEEDVIPEINPDREPITKLGDIWQLGKHRIICGDSTNPITYENLMDGKKAQMIFTDPPYNVSIDKHVCGLGSIKHREFAMASGEMTTDEFTVFLDKFIACIVANSNDGSLHYICMDWRHQKELITAAEKNYTELKNLCVWNKDNAGMGSLYRSKHELVYVYKNGTASHTNNVQLGANGRYRTNVWDYAGVNSFGANREDLELHPTVKPVQMILDAILDVTKRNDIVLDSFLGSGSTLIAADKVDRICYGVELDPIYVDTAIERYQQLTGKQAINVATGMKYDSLKEVRDEK